MASNRNRIAAALFGSSVSSLVLVIVTFATGVLVARALGPEARGVYGGMLLVVQTFVTITGISFSDGAIVSLRKTNKNNQVFLKTTLLTAAAIVVATTPILVVFGSILADYANAESVIFFVLFAGSYSLITALSSAFSAYERGNMRFAWTNVSRVMAPILFGLLLFTMIKLYPDRVGAEAILCVFLITKLPMLIIWISVYRSLYRGSFRSKFAVRSLVTGLRFHVAVALGVVAASFDRLVAVSVWSEETLGLYFVAFSAVGAGYGIVVTAVRTVLFPFLSGLLETERSDAIARVIRVTTLISVLSAIVGYFVIPFLIPAIYGADFAEAAGYAQMLLLALCVTPLHAVILEAGRSLGRGRASSEMALTALLVMVVGYILTGFREPYQAIAFLAFSNLASIIVGARLLLINRDIRLDLSMVPGSHDIKFLIKSLREGLNEKTK